MSVPQRAPGGFPVVGIIGGGQLARMCAAPAAELGISLSVLAEAPDAAAALVVPSSPVGEYTDVETVRRFARDCDVVTLPSRTVWVSRFIPPRSMTKESAPTRPNFAISCHTVSTSR